MHVSLENRSWNEFHESGRGWHIVKNCDFYREQELEGVL